MANLCGHNNFRLPFSPFITFASCLDQATAHSAALHNVFKSMWTYQFERSYMGFEPIPGICDPPATPTHPFGDPSLPYFQ
jgi:hypothetical protein